MTIKGYEHKDNNGSLFRNTDKQEPNHPDYRGSAKIGGIDYWVSGWLKDKEGKRWLSLAFKVKDRAKKPGATDQEPIFDDPLNF